MDIKQPSTNATSVPLNTTVQVEFNAPLDRTTVTANDFILYDNVTGQNIPATVSVDASGRIITLTPSQLLPVNRSFYDEWGTSERATRSKIRAEISYPRSTSIHNGL